MNHPCTSSAVVEMLMLLLALRNRYFCLYTPAQPLKELHASVDEFLHPLRYTF
jgi:hypothetical protein